jgi:poly(A) polymerase
MTSGQQQWGITPPVSTALPTDHELKLDKDLMDELKRQNNFESPEGSEKRKRILEHFDKAAKEFVRFIAKERGLPQSVQNEAGGMVVAYGSYRLGVSGPGQCLTCARYNKLTSVP